MRSHLWLFTEVLREIWPAVTQKVRKTADYTDVTDKGFLAGGRLTIWTPDSARLLQRRSERARGALYHSF